MYLQFNEKQKLCQCACVRIDKDILIIVRNWKRCAATLNARILSLGFYVIIKLCTKVIQFFTEYERVIMMCEEFTNIYVYTIVGRNSQNQCDINLGLSFEIRTVLSTWCSISI